MKSRYHSCFALLVSAIFSCAAWAVPASDLEYLPENIQYNPAIPKPEATLGYPVGTWHVRHDQLVNYFQTLAEMSANVQLKKIGESHEQRPLYLAAISSQKNLANLEKIRQRHLEQVKTGVVPKSDTDPLIIWMGYSVHGDEPSGSNASMLVAYYLAAAQSESVKQLLENTVILIDPALNPDGLSRFAQWANTHKGQNLVADGQHREHVQDWPSGRTNHYWFDLNRDWLLLTHPESRARVKEFHRWRPNILTDFHEMGTHSTYFFQPGIPSRKSPWTPEQNVSLTKVLAKFHASALDANKRLYFTEESYDDFYYGKGSTYPDAHAGIGILFEQASSRGHLQDSPNGQVSFPFTIQNQVTTSLSTFAGAMANKGLFQQYQHDFLKKTDKLIKGDATKGFLLQEKADKSRMMALLTLLQQHQIEIYPLTKDLKVAKKVFAAADSYYIPLNQPQYRLIKSIFSERKRFNDNTFYDVSNWNLPLAFNIRYQPVFKDLWRKVPVDKVWVPTEQPNTTVIDANAYAYGFSWQDSRAPKVLEQLLKFGAEVKAAGKPFVAHTSQGDVSFSAGSVLVPMGLKQPEGLADKLKTISMKTGIKIWSLNSGLTSQGIDLGSRQMLDIDPVKVLLIGGKGVSQYEVGEMWHYLDTQVGIPASVVEQSRVPDINLYRYTHIIFASGRYQGLDEAWIEKLRTWVKKGGVVIGQRTGSRWLAKADMLATHFVAKDDIKRAFDTKTLSYKDRDNLAGRQRIAGAVFDTKIDNSHPLTFGFPERSLPMFRNSDLVMKAPEQPFIMVGQYQNKPLVAGYTSNELQKQIAGSASIVAHGYGDGAVIAFADDVNFRGYWQGTSRLLSNAIFLSGFIDEEG